MASGTADTQVSEQWERVCAHMRVEIGEAAFQSWLKPMSVREISDGVVRISAPTRFMRDWVVAHFIDRLCVLWRNENPEIHAVDVFIQPERSQQRASAAKSEAPAPVIVKEKSGRSGSGESYSDDISAPLDSRFTFEKFVIGKSNEFAYAAAQRIAEASRVTFNPLFLYGGVGLGKTHLMHATAWRIRKSTPSRTVIYLSAEKFMYRFIRSLREQKIVDFKEMFRSVDVLMIDDVQFIGGKGSTQEEFFHTFNSLVDQGRQIIISADKSPSDLEGMEERLKSRLNCGLVADIHATTYELRLGILQSKSEQLGVEIPCKVMEFIAHKITSNVRELEGALHRVVAHAQLVGRDISLETAQEVLHDLLRSNDRRVTIEEIQKRVAAHFNIRISDMHSARRARSVARPRQVAMYLAKQLTSRSLPEIGRKFGGRDHTTVMHAVRKVDELRESDAAFTEDVELLRRMLEG
ncbi:MAG: chromosomal replication initiation protein DnaA [Rhodospirillales bacterium RIFCSPLOWO2_12_FULL_58_28]|nr:MAG: chromosomal replication initiation protein DnaA [Rhodospirillales bacterium RIFCSPLOWO2_02_FULL_58_16]OHC77911.1 MAG: chromosomal replication initiation protein DnaA [Rhodospirillales bacterium RIFCSPLOWO2_12_FULL_58_28]